ncbi:hypothetical protein LSH36_77g06025 [Paralvinella palmiformis]|uniref:LRRCT domain-containing protein n=1 Tax=Paralvinella palmiformis TaxID=53620 RepID=A0AAD9NDV3_9ANNE|nr:hypothetical protein LSH36_77g06025 [Paralvinella palmiformis]
MKTVTKFRQRTTYPMFVLLLFVINTECVWTVATPDDNCPRNCVCQDKQAHCDSASLLHMPDRLPHNIEALLMRNNLIQKINRRHLAKLRSLRHLILKGNRIYEIAPDTFRNQRQLISLSLTENNIHRLDPDTMKTMRELRFLSLRKNRLTDVEGLFSRLYNLQLVNLAHNRIKRITHRTFRHNWRLVILDLQDNRIRHIHKNAFRSMPLIRYLVLRDNPLGSLEINFKPNIHLELLDFTNCQLTNVVTGLPYSINDLRLSENKIAKIAAKDFHNTRKIRLLVLNANQIETIEDDAFSRMFQLYDLYIGGNAIERLPNKLPKSLHGIFANGNNMTQIQFDPLMHTHGLEFLYLHDNKISDIQHGALWSLGNLRSLDLSDNMIGDLKPMTFHGNKHLQKLDVSRNPLLQLESDSFVGLENLHIFQMSSVGSRYDRIRINPMIFKDMKRLLFLDLSNSSQVVQGLADNTFSLEHVSSVQDLNLMEDNLLGLPSNFASHFPNLQLIKLAGNPWHCDLDILWLAYWMRNRTVQFFAPYHMRCATPPDLKGRLIMELTAADLLPVTRQKPVITYIEVSLKKLSGSNLTGGTLDITRDPYQYVDKRYIYPPQGKTINTNMSKTITSYTKRFFVDNEHYTDGSDVQYITPSRNINLKTMIAQSFKTVAPKFFDDNRTAHTERSRRKIKAKQGKKRYRNNRSKHGKRKREKRQKNPPKK